MNNQIKYDILFNADTSKLQQVKTELEKLANIRTQDLSLVNPQSTIKSLQEMQTKVFKNMTHMP